MTRKALLALTALCLLLALALPACAETEGPTLGSRAEVTSYIKACADRLDDEIVFYYTAALDETFATPDAMWAIGYNNGLLDWAQYRNTEKRRVNLKEIQYYPGVKIAWAAENNRLDILTEDEKRTLEKAQWMAEQSRMYAQTPFEVLRQIHDRLVQQVTYKRVNPGEGWVYGDTALGALLDGVAECDGYADAFYLLCRLSGFEVGFQHGISDNGEDDPTTHLWNLLKIDGWWYQVDVTWDDLDDAEDPAICRYRYFIIGGEMLKGSHTWDQSLSPYQQANWNNWEWFYYTFDNSGIAYGAYYNTLQDAANYIAYMQREHGATRFHVMVDGNYDNGKALNAALQETSLKGSWTTWTRNMGEYACFDITMRN